MTDQPDLFARARAPEPAEPPSAADASLPILYSDRDEPVELRAPFVYFGGKSRAAPLVWAALGDVHHYVEPFAGSLAVLFERPAQAVRAGRERIETVNDLDCLVANFWRSVSKDPQSVAAHADWPVSECDLHARQNWIVNQHAFRERMLTDPDYFDARIAGWWVWGMGQFIGDKFCDPAKNPPPRTRVRMRGTAGVCGSTAPDTYHWFQLIAERLRPVHVACGTWEKCVTPAALGNDPCGVFLDPPYLEGAAGYSAGGVGTNLSATVREWALENGTQPHLRIVLAGYEGEHDEVEKHGWSVVQWKAHGGMSSGRKGGDGNGNRLRERLWLSPHCLRGDGPLFAAI